MRAGYDVFCDTGGLAIFTAIRRASSFVSNFAAARVRQGIFDIPLERKPVFREIPVSLVFLLIVASAVRGAKR
jgi:hypothetical protein